MKIFPIVGLALLSSCAVTLTPSIGQKIPCPNRFKGDCYFVEPDSLSKVSILSKGWTVVTFSMDLNGYAPIKQTKDKVGKWPADFFRSNCKYEYIVIQEATLRKGLFKTRNIKPLYIMPYNSFQGL
jgi:hypothetical protein